MDEVGKLCPTSRNPFIITMILLDLIMAQLNRMCFAISITVVSLSDIKMSVKCLFY